MRILIEEHQYPAELVQDVLHGVEALQSIEGRVSLSYVGYFYNTKLRDCVFILPKVLMNEQDQVFGKYSPEAMIHFERMEPALTDEERKFIYEFAVLHESDQLFAAKYMAYMPTEEELRKTIEEQKRFFLEQHS